MKLSCPLCTEDIQYDLMQAGKTVTCSHCKRAVMMPSLDQLPIEYQRQYRHEQFVTWEKQQRQLKKLEEQKLQKQQLEEQRQQRAVERERQRKQGAHIPSVPVRIIQFLDLRFQRYLTPWIIRCTWIWAICLACLLLFSHLCICSYQSLPSKDTVRQVVPGDIMQKKERLACLIEKETFEAEQRKRASTVSSPHRTEPATEEMPRVSTEEHKEEKDMYTDMTLEQLKTELANLEKQYPATKEVWTWRHLWFNGLAAIVGILAAVLSLVGLRVFCESVIVIFSIAIAISAIKEQLVSNSTRLEHSQAMVGDGNSDNSKERNPCQTIP